MDRSRSFLLRNMKPPNVNTFTSVLVLGAIIIAVMFSYAAFGDDEDQRPTLKYASIIFRHGDKTPSSTYANDPYQFWPEGWGQLTNNGKEQMFQLGQYLRLRYSKFVGRYSGQTVRVDSSDHDRCHQSAAVLLAALFPPQEEQVWNNQLLWQPIPIHATPLQMDKLIVVKATCPLYIEEKTKADKELGAIYDKQNEKLYKYLTEHAGQNIENIFDVESLYNILEIERNSGKVLPNWTASVFPDKMKDIASLVLASFTYTPVMKRLKGGPLVGDITRNMKACADGKNKQKLSLYSAHDLTIVNVMRALGFIDVTFKPQLGAAIIMELHIINNDPQVELYYVESYAASAAVRWLIPDCPSPCSLAHFSEAMSSVIPLNWDVECYSNHS